MMLPFMNLLHPQEKICMHCVMQVYMHVTQIYIYKKKRFFRVLIDTPTIIQIFCRPSIGIKTGPDNWLNRKLVIYLTRFY